LCYLIIIINLLLTIIIYLTIINYYLCYLTLIVFVLIPVLNGPNFYVNTRICKMWARWIR